MPTQSKSLKRKRGDDHSPAPPSGPSSVLDPINSGRSSPALGTGETTAYRGGQAAESLSQSTAPLDLAALPATRVSKPPSFVSAPNSAYFLTPDVPVNKSLFRYSPAGAAEPGNLVLHRSQESAPAGYVRASWEDRSPHIRSSQDGLTMEGFGGFRSVRCNVPVREGKWYMEVHIERASRAAEGEGGEQVGTAANRAALGRHVRLGWGRREASLNGPVGLDGYSYGIRDLSGDKVTLSRPKPYGRPFGQGDVIGMYISLPPKRTADPNDPDDPARLMRKRIPIGLKLQPYFEMAEYPVSPEMKALMDDQTKAIAAPPTKKTKPRKMTEVKTPNLRPMTILEGSRIAYFINGECQGVAFSNLYDYLQLRESSKKKTKDRSQRYLNLRHNPYDDGTLGYYPFLSLFHEAVIRINTGPEFAFPPPPDIDALVEGRLDDAQNGARTWRPMSERYDEYIAEMMALDDLEEQQARENTARANEKSEIAEYDAEDEKIRLQRERRRERDRARREAQRVQKKGGTGPKATIAAAIKADPDRAQSGTPAPVGGKSAHSRVPSTAEPSPTPPPGGTLDASLFNPGKELTGAQRRRAKAGWEQYVMSLDESGAPSASMSQSPAPVFPIGDRSMTGTPAPVTIKVEDLTGEEPPPLPVEMETKPKMEIDT
jgi:COMPASS component BRE2